MTGNDGKWSAKYSSARVRCLTARMDFSRFDGQDPVHEVETHSAARSPGPASCGVSGGKVGIIRTPFPIGNPERWRDFRPTILTKTRIVCNLGRLRVWQLGGTAIVREALSIGPAGRQKVNSAASHDYEPFAGVKPAGAAPGEAWRTRSACRSVNSRRHSASASSALRMTLISPLPSIQAWATSAESATPFVGVDSGAATPS